MAFSYLDLVNKVLSVVFFLLVSDTNIGYLNESRVRRLGFECLKGCYE